MIIVIISEEYGGSPTRDALLLLWSVPIRRANTSAVKVTLLSLRPGQELDNNSFTDKSILCLQGQVYFPPVRNVCRNCNCCSLLMQVFTATFCSGPPMSHLKIVLMLPTFLVTRHDPKRAWWHISFQSKSRYLHNKGMEKNAHATEKKKGKPQKGTHERKKKILSF